MKNKVLLIGKQALSGTCRTNVSVEATPSFDGKIMVPLAKTMKRAQMRSSDAQKEKARAGRQKGEKSPTPVLEQLWPSKSAAREEEYTYVYTYIYIYVYTYVYSPCTGSPTHMAGLSSHSAKRPHMTTCISIT